MWFVERLVLLAVIVAMVNRGGWLLADPPFSVHPPDWTGWLFLCGAVTMLYPWLVPRYWGKSESLMAAAAVIVRYWLYCWWVLASFPFERVQGTLGELLLIPVLVAFSFGRRWIIF